MDQNTIEKILTYILLTVTMLVLFTGCATTPIETKAMHTMNTCRNMCITKRVEYYRHEMTICNCFIKDLERERQK